MGSAGVSWSQSVLQPSTMHGPTDTRDERVAPNRSASHGAPNKHAGHTAEPPPAAREGVRGHAYREPMTPLEDDLTAEWSQYPYPLSETTAEVAAIIARHVSEVEPAEVEDLAGGLYGVRLSRPRGNDGRWHVVIGCDQTDGWWGFAEHPEVEDQMPVVVWGQNATLRDVLDGIDLISRRFSVEGAVAYADVAAGKVP